MKTKKNKILFISLVIVAGLLVVLLIFVVINSKDDKNDKNVQTSMDEIQRIVEERGLIDEKIDKDATSNKVINPDHLRQSLKNLDL